MFKRIEIVGDFTPSEAGDHYITSIYSSSCGRYYHRIIRWKYLEVNRRTPDQDH
jgi:hypothetical protein